MCFESRLLTGETRVLSKLKCIVQKEATEKTHNGHFIYMYIYIYVYLYTLYVCVCVCVLDAQSCLTVCNSMDCTPPGSPVHGIFQARTLEWVVISFSISYIYVK